MEVKWSQEAKSVFDKVISNLPQFHRTIARQLVKNTAEDLARNSSRQEVLTEHCIKAFFKEVPPAFLEMMKKLMAKLGIEYEQYIDEAG